MSPILVIENDRRDPLGNLGGAIEARGMTTHVVRPPEGEEIPPPHDYTALVVLGGPQGAYESDIHPYLEDEMEAIRQAVAADIPVLGICLGSQLAAHALGGRAYKAVRPEVAVIEPRLTPEGQTDALGALLTRPVLTFHQDSFDLPPQAQVLARSDRFTQAFRCGSVLAIQPHPEVAVDDVAHWVTTSDLPKRAGVDGDELILRVRSTVKTEDALALFDAWLDEVDTD